MNRSGLAATRTTLLLLLLAGFGARGIAAEPATERPKYIRIARDASQQPLALQTAIVHFTGERAKGDVEVDLVGAVHVGEKDYYDALNKRFEDYDVVLFELVAPEGTQIPKGGRPSTHPVGMLQDGLKNILDLEHQLQHVDYTKKNFVHADMSPDQFDKTMEERGESFFTMFFRMMGQAMAQQTLNQNKNQTSDFDLLAAMFSPNRAEAMKRVMAEQFENADGMMLALEGPEGSTIITERNKVALAKLAEQLDAGKKKVAIFYGAGHLGDMEERLIEEFQLKRSGEEWLDAWNLEKPSRARKPERPAKKAAGILPGAFPVAENTGLAAFLSQLR